MTTTTIKIIPIVIAAYFAIGLVFSIYFFLSGAKRLDKGIKASPWTTRLILIPGAIAMWIFLIPKLFKNSNS